MEANSYTFMEMTSAVIGTLLVLAFGAWGAVIKSSADQMGEQIERVIGEIARLREEIHHDRVMYERRFSRLEHPQTPVELD